jgi:hypothetical protein
MKRHVPGLEQTVSGKHPLVDGFYLVRVDRIAYRYDSRRPHFWIHFGVLEPKQFAGRDIEGRLRCNHKALWKLSWFLRDFGYDPERLNDAEVDERAVVTLKGIVHIAHTFENGRRVGNLAGFAPAAQWAELSSLLPPGGDLNNEAA